MLQRQYNMLCQINAYSITKSDKIVGQTNLIALLAVLTYDLFWTFEQV